MRDLIIILGPTAAGKTEIAIRIAKAMDGEIISADSMQIYDEMSIGTARPLPEEQGGISHHLLGFLAPNAEYSVACYQKDARAAIESIFSRGKQPILAGGTGLYINSIAYDIDFTAAGPNEALRAALAEEYEKNPEQMHERLSRLDPEAARRIHKNDKKRLVRRLEILEGGGEHAYDFRRPQDKYNLHFIGIGKERENLYRDIERRVDIMFEEGLEREVRDVFEKYGSDIAAFSAIGYKEFLPYFAGNATLEETRAVIKQNTRRFAKRQMTWFRREPEIRWFYTEEFSNKEEMAQAILCHISARRKENQ